MEQWKFKKLLFLLQIAAKSFDLVLNFPVNSPHKKKKNNLWLFEISSWWFLFFFSRKSKFSIVSYRELETWKASGRRAKQGGIWDSLIAWVIVEHIWSRFGLVAFSHFGVLRCICDLWRKCDFENTASSAVIILLHLNFSYVFHCDRPHKTYFFEFWNLN